MAGKANTVQLDRFAVRAMEQHWLRFRKAVKRCRKQCSEKSVHDLRISIRRFLSTWDMVGQILGPQSIAAPSRKLKRLLKLCSPLRDTHIRLSYLRALAPRFPALDQVCQAAHNEERKLFRYLHRKIRKVNLEAFQVRVLKTQKLLRKTLRQESAQHVQFTRLLASVRAAFGRVELRWQRFDPLEPATLHRGRVAFKQFRYLVEALQPVLSGVTAVQLRQMRAFQTRLGNIQDVEVIAEWLKDFAACQDRRQTEVLSPVQEELVKRRQRLIRLFLKSAGEVYHFVEVLPAACRPKTEIARKD